MRVYYLSDLHNDYHQRNLLLDLKGDTNAVLFIAGDINCKGRSLRDIEEVADRWKHIVWVSGNHDHWKLALHETHKFKSELPNVHHLLNETVTIGDVTFCGTTLWVHIEDKDSFDWKITMNDAKKIRGPHWRRLSHTDINTEHMKAVQFIQECQEGIKGKKVLITHHALCEGSIGERFIGDEDNRYYVSDRVDLLEGWHYHIHRHLHNESDYMVGGCNVVCNPHGYGSENPEFGIRLFDI
jgi:hypothetical protein